MKYSFSLDTVCSSRNNENQVTLGSTRLCLNSFDMFWLGYFPDNFCNIDSHHLLICCVTNVFTAAKFFLTIFSCFYKHWTWLRRISLTKYYYHVTAECQNEPTLYSCLNVKELLARNRPHIWSLSDRIRTHNQLVRKRTPFRQTDQCLFTN